MEFNGQNVDRQPAPPARCGRDQARPTVPVEIHARRQHRKLWKSPSSSFPAPSKLAEEQLTSDNDTGTLNGVGVGDLDQQARDQFQVPDNVKGAVIDRGRARVRPRLRPGLKPGDVIQGINHHPVKDADEAVQLTENRDTTRRRWFASGRTAAATTWCGRKPKRG